MPRLAKELSAVAVRALKEPGHYPVGGVPGLMLQVAPPPSQARTWILRFRLNGLRRAMGLGGFDLVTLAAAREKARAARALVSEGVDPIEQRRGDRSAIEAAHGRAMTFRACALAYIEAHEAGWRNAKHGQQWRNTLEQYAFPIMGALLVEDVAMAHVLRVLEQRIDKANENSPKLWHARTETASRLRGRIEKVLDWAKGRGYREGDNAAAWKGNLNAQLPKPEKIVKVVHHRALAVGDVGAFMVNLRAAAGQGARALEFTILTAARSGEVRGATWAEIDLKAAVWTVPAERMKVEKEHRVPLSVEAVALLKELPRIEGNTLVFPAPRGGPLSDMTLSAVLRRMGVDAVPHGFRSTFRDWASERTNYPRDVAEMALAHTIGDKVEAAYRRGDLFEKRRMMMQDWANFCATVPAVEGSTVVPIRGAA